MVKDSVDRNLECTVYTPSWWLPSSNYHLVHIYIYAYAKGISFGQKVLVPVFLAEQDVDSAIRPTPSAADEVEKVEAVHDE